MKSPKELTNSQMSALPALPALLPPPMPRANTNQSWVCLQRCLPVKVVVSICLEELRENTGDGDTLQHKAHTIVHQFASIRPDDVHANNDTSVQPENELQYAIWIESTTTQATTVVGDALLLQVPFPQLLP